MFVKEFDVWTIIKFKRAFEKSSQRSSKIWKMILKKSLFLKNVNCDEEKACWFKNDTKVSNDVSEKTENCENDNDMKIEKCATCEARIIENDRNSEKICAKKWCRLKWFATKLMFFIIWCTLFRDLKFEITWMKTMKMMF